MRTRLTARLGVVGVLGLAGGLLATAPADAKPAAPPSEGGFWTHDKVAKARPREYVRDRGTGRFVLKGKPNNPGGGGGGKGGGGSVTGAPWPGNNLVNRTVGKVLFALGTQPSNYTYWVCSATLATDAMANASVVLTAAHCVYDNDPSPNDPAVGTGFAKQWTFIPDYDAAPAPLSTSNQDYCADTQHGCWDATRLVAHSGFTGAGGFTFEAVLHDYAFAVLGVDGNAGTLAETAAGGSQAISFTTSATKKTVHAFGYPAGAPYVGTDLVYCKGSAGTDPLMSKRTYKLGCDMTGGSSGGGWMVNFGESSGAGTLVSLNSYGYQGQSNMYGPMFDAKTQAVHTVANGGSAPGVVTSN